MIRSLSDVGSDMLLIGFWSADDIESVFVAVVVVATSASTGVVFP